MATGQIRERPGAVGNKGGLGGGAGGKKYMMVVTVDVVVVAKKVHLARSDGIGEGGAVAMLQFVTL